MGHHMSLAARLKEMAKAVQGAPLGFYLGFSPTTNMNAGLRTHLHAFGTHSLKRGRTSLADPQLDPMRALREAVREDSSLGEVLLLVLSTGSL
jgi:hypothetical protein